MIERTPAEKAQTALHIVQTNAYRYYGRALALRTEGVAPHSPHSCGCLACSDLRAYLGMAPLKTDTERRCRL